MKTYEIVMITLAGIGGALVLGTTIYGLVKSK